MNAPPEVAALVSRERALRAADPLRGAQARLTRSSDHGAGSQWAFVTAPNRIRVAEGGNQSGKTWVGVWDFGSQARGVHPTRSWAPGGATDTWRGWYATTTFDRFSQQAWGHFKRLLLYPGESMLKLPTRNVLAVGWDNRNPERPTYLRIRRYDGGVAEVWIKSYDQGAGEFQSAEVDAIVIDEECPRAIWEECQPRVLARAGGITVTATPVQGVEWLEGLRQDAESGASDVFHCRLDTRDNPGLPEGEIERMAKGWRARPELLNLRLAGIPMAMEGSVYPDTLFLPAHVCEPFEIPREWTRYRVIDHGWRACGCLWAACSPQEELVIYREYLGEERTIGQNAAEILKLSGREGYAAKWIDPATLGRDAATGKRVIDLWNDEGADVAPAPDNEVQAGIEQVWEWLVGFRAEEGAARVPLFRVFRSCQRFLEERRGYRFHDAREKGDEGPVKPVKRADHLMDCWRYLVAAGPRWVPTVQGPPPEGTLAWRLWKKRHEAEQKARKRL
jgi:phage terminase large subunit-like protein